MKHHRYSKRSWTCLASVRPEMVGLAVLLLHRSPYDIGIVSGGRTLEEQKKMVASGASKTLKSDHLRKAVYGESLSSAFDFAVFHQGRYVNGDQPGDFEKYRKVADLAKEIAQLLLIDLEWGGDWKSFKDVHHLAMKGKL